MLAATPAHVMPASICHARPVGQLDRPLSIDPMGAAAIAAVRTRAVRDRDRYVERIERTLSSAEVSVEVDSLCSGALRHARVTLNFHPDRRLADGRSVGSASSSTAGRHSSPHG